MKKKLDKNLTVITLIVTFCSIGLSLTLTYLFTWRVPFPAGTSRTIDPAIFGQLGDAIGGIVGTAIGLLTVYLLLKTYHSQKVELEATQNALYDQRAETAVFSMLATLREIVNETSGIVRVINAQTNVSHDVKLNGRDYIHSVLLEVKRTFTYTDIERDLMFSVQTKHFHIYYQTITDLTGGGRKNLRKAPTDKFYTVADAKIAVGTAFLSGLEPFLHNFDHYFRFFRTTVEYMDSIEYTDDKARYFKLITAQLSQDELVMLFYYTITSDAKFLTLVDKQKILAPILNPGSLFDIWHHWLLPETPFKFLTDGDLVEKMNFGI